MSVLEHLERMGGVATRATLVRVCSRAAVDAALAAGDLTVLARGRYALPQAERAVLEAHRLSGVVSHLSAALSLGWSVMRPPDQPHVTVSSNRHVSMEQRRDVALHWSRLGTEDVDGMVTRADRTLVDCLRTLPYAEALAVADSAVRNGFPQARLVALALSARGPSSAAVRRVARNADPRAANPFESGLRAICHEVPGLHVEPQVSIHEGGFLGRPDLIDERLRIVFEADSFEWHGSRVALARDARRYNRFGLAGWLVLRFTWEDVMLEPANVRSALAAAVVEREHQLCHGCRSA
ncbi:hypothetical protein [Nocardioides sp. InS609-2]|uniref:hypothetical protein n=1 Tax=Nocardioides sp. InS609-2 TaxID=2760705 RepID=UPI0020C00179|nr:hypothetical protein [Nocardioides sp. InS609-2]